MKLSTPILAALGAFAVMGSAGAQPASSNAVFVNVKGQLLLTADWATARYNQTTPMALAQTWADNMRGVLPELTRAK